MLGFKPFGAWGIVLGQGWCGRISSFDGIVRDSTGAGIGSQEEIVLRPPGLGTLDLNFVDFDNNARSGLYLVGPVATLWGCSSTNNNGRYGAEVRRGSVLNDRGGNTVTGGLGDLELGGGAVAWAALPAVGTETNWAG